MYSGTAAGAATIDPQESRCLARCYTRTTSTWMLLLIDSCMFPEPWPTKASEKRCAAGVNKCRASRLEDVQVLSAMCHTALTSRAAYAPALRTPGGNIKGERGTMICALIEG